MVDTGHWTVNHQYMNVCMLEAKIHLQGRVDRTKELSLLSNVECAKQTNRYL